MLRNSWLRSSCNLASSKTFEGKNQRVRSSIQCLPRLRLFWIVSCLFPKVLAMLSCDNDGCSTKLIIKKGVGFLCQCFSALFFGSVWCLMPTSGISMYDKNESNEAMPYLNEHVLLVLIKLDHDRVMFTIRGWKVLQVTSDNNKKGLEHQKLSRGWFLQSCRFSYILLLRTVIQSVHLRLVNSCNSDRWK